MTEYVEMATQEMKQFLPSSPAHMRQTELSAEAAAESILAIAADAREQYYYTLIREIVEQRYDLGELLDVYQIFGGYVNMTFGVYTLKDGQKATWIVRKYRKGKTLEALEFEHRLLLHAHENGSLYTATPQRNREGGTYVVETIDDGPEQGEYFIAVFNYIGGDRKYDWMPNWAVDSLKDITVESAALTMAQFHSATYDFDPQGLRGDNILGTVEDLHVNELIADFPRRLLAYRQLYRDNGMDNKFTEYMDTFQDRYTQWCAKATIPAAAYEQMLICPCQLDFHGGNFKYWEDESVSGSFDYDMAMVDSRLFDIGLGMHYTLASWGLADNGAINLARVEQFVNAYNRACKDIGRIPPLNTIERQYFFEAMLQGPIYVYGWAQGDVSTDMGINEYEYLFYGEHFSNSCEWLLAHEQEVRNLADRLD